MHEKRTHGFYRFCHGFYRFLIFMAAFTFSLHAGGRTLIDLEIEVEDETARDTSQEQVGARRR